MAISVVQSKAVTDATSGSLTSPTTAGNCLVVCLSTFMSSNVTITLSGVTLGGSAGNFAQAAKVQSAFSSSTQFAAVWVDPNCSGGQTAVAVSGTNLNLSSGNDTGFVIYEVSGLATSSVTDQPQTSSGTTGSSPTTGTTAATSQASEIALAAITAENAISAFTSGYTVTSINDGGGVFSAGAYKVLSATGTQSFGCTQSPGTGPWAGAIVTLKSAATTVSGAASLNGEGALSGAWAFAETAPLAGAGALGGTGMAVVPGAASLDGQGALGAAGVLLVPGAGAASLNGEGALGGTATEVEVQSAALAGEGALGGQWTGTLLQSAALAGEGTLSETEKLGFTVALAGAGSLSIPQVAGGLVNGVGGAAVPVALPGSSQVAVAPPGSSNWQWLGTLGQVTALTYSYVCPGGCDKMSMTIMCPASFRTQLFNPGWQVKITRGGHQVWDGKLDEPQPSAQGWTLTAVGTGNLGANFVDYYSIDDVWPVSEPDEIINRAVSRGLPWANPGLNSSPYFSQFWLGQATDPGSSTVTAFLNLICTRGGLVWYVNSQPGGAYNADDLSVFPLPTTPNRLLVCTTPVARTLGGYTNAILIRYQQTADNTTTNVAATFGVVSAQNTASMAAHGTLEAYLDLSNAGTLTAAQALAVGQNILATFEAASYSGPFTASYGQLLNMGGQAIDPGTDQAGTRVKLVLVDGGYGGEVVPGPIVWTVGAYEWNDFSMQATLTPYQEVDASLSGLLSRTSTTMTPLTVA